MPRKSTRKQTRKQSRRLRRTRTKRRVQRRRRMQRGGALENHIRSALNSAMESLNTWLNIPGHVHQRHLVKQFLTVSGENRWPVESEADLEVAFDDANLRSSVWDVYKIMKELVDHNDADKIEATQMLRNSDLMYPAAAAGPGLRAAPAGPGLQAAPAGRAIWENDWRNLGFANGLGGAPLQAAPAGVWNNQMPFAPGGAALQAAPAGRGW